MKKSLSAIVRRVQFYSSLGIRIEKREQLLCHIEQLPVKCVVTCRVKPSSHAKMFEMNICAFKYFRGCKCTHYGYHVTNTIVCTVCPPKPDAKVIFRLIELYANLWCPLELLPNANFSGQKCKAATGNQMTGNHTGTPQKAADNKWSLLLVTDRSGSGSLIGATWSNDFHRAKEPSVVSTTLADTRFTKVGQSLTRSLFEGSQKNAATEGVTPLCPLETELSLQTHQKKESRTIRGRKNPIFRVERFSDVWNFNELVAH
ncbi:hypothetical protein CSKR_101553 [Clonorchis sinensis]|uniref:Uncharacterized protein n=2 Tax=Clonorchis sinensis TaxID=79923 RepID=A0A8T1MKL2_CLOSI|nr:hypothetical protein CSKR_101553 [Clonorchis sinensis]GAA47662.1 hypothetical protein CLF_100646 [Clonorchis sinensis]